MFQSIFMNSNLISSDSVSGELKQYKIKYTDTNFKVWFGFEHGTFSMTQAQKWLSNQFSTVIVSKTFVNEFLHQFVLHSSYVG